MNFVIILPLIAGLSNAQTGPPAPQPPPSTSKVPKQVLPQIWPLFPTKINMTGYLKITKELPFFRPLPPAKNRVKEQSVFQALQAAYSVAYYNFVKQARSATNDVEDGMSDVLPACASCKGSPIGKERTQCYSSCITRQLDIFSPYAYLIGETVQNFFCVPLGFGFERPFLSGYFPPKWFYDFEEFVELFNSNLDSFSMSSLVETWMSNVLWLDKTPVHLHSFIKSRLAIDIAQAQLNKNLKVKPTVDVGETTAQFAEKCGNQWDLREVVYSLVNAAKDKSHFLEVILRGLYTVRSAAFYTMGDYTNLAGGIMEALAALAGTKCNLISYSEGGKMTNSTCDGIGRYPLPQFPVPALHARLIPSCEYDNLPFIQDK